MFMSNWIQCELGDLVIFQRGHDLPKTSMVKGEYPVVGSNGIIGYHNKYTTDAPSITIGRSGNVGNPYIYYGKTWSHNTTLYIKEFKNIDPVFAYYFLRTLKLDNYAGGSAVPTLNRNHIHSLPVSVPSDVEIQKKIASILKNIDDKIEENNKINNNLEQQVLAIYRNTFVDVANSNRTICRADEYFDITIGKTPPRKEPQWFSMNPNDITWVSISDMGNCGLYISNSSERLTLDAVQKHNVKIVPDNTVILSFKLTVGRVAITNGEMTTNEAIAHFKTDKKEINEYLYCYLKSFNYQTMGSTSSIATAVNSKIIKGMPFVVPTNEEIDVFHSIAAPMFEKIKENQLENTNLMSVRDALLPKLMSGELSVSDIDF